MDVSPRVVELLGELEVLLAEPLPTWSASMARFRARAAAVETAQDRRSLLSDVLSIYAGMASFNDAVIQDHDGVKPEQRRFGELRRQLYDAARDAL